SGLSRPSPSLMQPPLAVPSAGCIMQMRKIFVDGAQFFVAHSSDRLPRHLLADFMPVRIDAAAHGGDKFLEFPILDQIEVRTDGPELTRDAAGEIPPMALAAILVGQDVFAIAGCRGSDGGG